MAQPRVERLEERMDQIERRVEQGFAAGGRRIEDAYATLGEGFVEHRRLIIAHIDGRLHELRTDLQNEIAGVRTDLRAELGVMRTELRTEAEALRTELRAELHTEIGAVRTEMRRGDASVRAQMRDGFAAVNASIDAQAAETRVRFDRLESKIDAFVDAQSAISQRLLEYMERHA